MDDLAGGRRSRVVAVGAAVLTVVAGLGARAVLPDEAAKAAGDALYTALVYALVVAVAPRLRARTVAAVALAISTAVELFQATGVPAGLARHSLLARLVLGTTFNVPDLFWYVVGAALARGVHLLLTAGRFRAASAPR